MSINNFERKMKSRTVRIVVTVVGCLFAGMWLFLGPLHLVAKRHFSRKIIPSVLLAEDFQRPIDREILEQLEFLDKAKPMQWVDYKILKPYLDDLQTAEMNISGVEVKPGQFPDYPELSQIVEDCVKILHIKNRPRVFIVNEFSTNAYTTNFVDPIIVISSDIIGNFRDPDELRFIIGHELGHIKCNHVRWHTVARILIKTLNENLKVIPKEVKLAPFIPLLKWCREAEMSCDNAGLLCCQNLEAAERALVRLKLGLSEDFIGEIDVDLYISQRSEQEISAFADAMLFFKEISQPHPFICNRIEELRKYATSERYKAIFK